MCQTYRTLMAGLRADQEDTSCSLMSTTVFLELERHIMVLNGTPDEFNVFGGKSIFYKLKCDFSNILKNHKWDTYYFGPNHKGPL